MFLLLATLRHPHLQRDRRRAGRKARVDRRRSHRHRPLPARRRHRQKRAASPLRLAARRHGRPHARLGPHPRRHHGHRRRLHDRPHPLPLRPLALRPADRRHRWSGHGHLRRHHRPRPDRHQARPRLLHRLAARLHVPGLRCCRLFSRHLPPDDPRLLQGAALPRRRLGHSRPRRRTGPAQNGRPPSPHAHHVLDHDGCRFRHCRIPSPRRLSSPRTRSSTRHSCKAPAARSSGSSASSPRCSRPSTCSASGT